MWKEVFVFLEITSRKCSILATTCNHGNTSSPPPQYVKASNASRKTSLRAWRYIGLSNNTNTSLVLLYFFSVAICEFALNFMHGILQFKWRTYLSYQYSVAIQSVEDGKTPKKPPSIPPFLVNLSQKKGYWKHDLKSTLLCLVILLRNVLNVAVLLFVVRQYIVSVSSVPSWQSQ